MGDRLIDGHVIKGSIVESARESAIVIDHIINGKKILAIKALREISGCDLITGKIIVEFLEGDREVLLRLANNILNEEALLHKIEKKVEEKIEAVKGLELRVKRGLAISGRYNLLYMDAEEVAEALRR